MAALLSIRVWIALAVVAALAFSHFTVYRKGKNYVRMEWNAAKAVANDDARRIEQRRQSMVDEAGAAAAKREAVVRADAARSRLAADGLRSTLDATEHMARQSHSAATVAVAAYRNVFQQCVNEYQALGELADRHSADALKLHQSWPK